MTSLQKKKNMSYRDMGKIVAIRVGCNLQEDIHVVQDCSDGRVFSIICHNLEAKSRETESEKVIDILA